jgi:hypothetical protein
MEEEKGIDLVIRYCKKKRRQLKCGFGEPGSLCGNGRWRCLKCGEEEI